MPIIGVLFFAWELYPIVLLYWLENIVIGALNIFKMLTNAEAKAIIKKILMSLFFSVHYGLFCFVHGALLINLFGKDSDSLDRVPMMIIDSGLKWALLALILSHTFSLISNFFLKSEYKQLSTSDIMFMPYKRIIILHIFIIFGAMVLQLFGVTQTGLIALAIVKILADLMAHKIEHRNS